MKRCWRVIDTGPADAFTNMAFDEALLRGYSLHSSPPTLRVYGWIPAALSLGYSQDAREVLDTGKPERFVRRITGGGIIRHGDELTYSLVCSKEDLGVPERVVSSYKTISSFLITFYRSLGLDAAFACDTVEHKESLGIPSVFCYDSKEKYDIVIAGRKIGGSAQKRSRNVIFQHGSIPFTQLEKVLNRPPDAAELSASLIRAFEATFGIALKEGNLSPSEEALLQDLKARKYKSREWNFDRIDVTMVDDGHKNGTALVGQQKDQSRRLRVA